MNILKEISKMTEVEKLQYEIKVLQDYFLALADITTIKADENSPLEARTVEIIQNTCIRHKVLKMADSIREKRKNNAKKIS